MIKEPTINKSEIISANKRYVEYVAKKYLNQGLLSNLLRKATRDLSMPPSIIIQTEDIPSFCMLPGISIILLETHCLQSQKTNLSAKNYPYCWTLKSILLSFIAVRERILILL